MNFQKALTLLATHVRNVCDAHNIPESMRCKIFEFARRFTKALYDAHDANEETVVIHPDTKSRGSALACALTVYGMQGEFCTFESLSYGETHAAIRSMRKIYFTTLPKVMDKSEIRNYDSRMGRPVLDVLNRFTASQGIHLDVVYDRIVWASRRLEEKTFKLNRQADFEPTVVAAAIFYWCCHRFRSGNAPAYTLDILTKQWCLKSKHIKHAVRSLDPVFRQAFSTLEYHGVLDDLPEQDRKDEIHNVIMNDRIDTIRKDPNLHQQWKRKWESLLQIEHATPIIATTLQTGSIQCLSIPVIDSTQCT